MAQSTPVVITQESDFTDAFTGEIVGTTNGQWQFVTTGSTGTSMTGPGTNNADAFMHTEASGFESIADKEANGVAAFATVPVQVSRVLHLRVCIQGDFGDGTEGLEIQHRQTDADSWAMAGFIPGWMYSNAYAVGDTITDENGVDQTCVAAGGWVDVEVMIPDAAMQVRFQPRYLGTLTIRHDIALRSFFWEWPDLTTGQADQPINLDASEIAQTSVLVSWDAPDETGGNPITGYEVRIGSGAWTNTGTSATESRLEGLTPGTTYMVQVRAVTSLGAGVASATLVVQTLASVQATVPRFVSAIPTGRQSVDLAWQAPSSNGGSVITHYQICVIDEDGTVQPFENTDDARLRWRVRGLAYGHEYGFRVRAVNSVGVGPATEIVKTIPIPARTITIPPGHRIPLIDTDRQSLIVRLAEIDCRVTVFWQPSDVAWYATLEVPVNTVVVSSKRLAVDSGILDRVKDILPGNIFCRALESERMEPQRDAWRRPTHALIWTPD